jgi:hypothetical protein
MTFCKAEPSKQMASGRGMGSFPTPVRGKRRRACEPSFKGGGDEEIVVEGQKGGEWQRSPRSGS